MSAARLITAIVYSTVLLASSLMGIVARADAPIVVTGFSTPESAIHDDAADVYLVSNVNGNPAALDNNGFISRIAPSGVILQLSWIRGGVGGVTLNGPKGMAIRDDVSMSRTSTRCAPSIGSPALPLRRIPCRTRSRDRCFSTMSP
jgi:hypothetical protein